MHRDNYKHGDLAIEHSPRSLVTSLISIKFARMPGKQNS
jgi:hypothetical protein